MVFIPKSRVVEGYRENVSIGIVTNPWTGSSNSAEQGGPTRRETPAARYQNQDSVSGTLRISDMVAPRKIPPGGGWRKFLYQAYIPRH